MKGMEKTGPALHQETWSLEGTYTEQDLRVFAAFLAKRVAGSRIWALGLFMALPLLWIGPFRTSWPFVVPGLAAVAGFLLLLRFVILPARLYKAASRLPGVFAPRRIAIDDEEVRNISAAGGHTFRLADIQEVVPAPGHLFVMVRPKQGIPIPRAWVGDARRQARLASHLAPGSRARG